MVTARFFLSILESIGLTSFSYICSKNVRMHQNLNIVLVQTNILWEDKPKNIEKLTSVLSEIKGEQKIVLFPEMFTTGFTMLPQKLAEFKNGETIQWMQNLSAKMGFAIGGSLIIKESENYLNRFIFVTPNGGLFQYDKRHLFRMGKENEVYAQGNQRVVFEYMGWRILPQICYDLRFPVWCRNRNDYDLMVNVANFPESRRDVWNTLLKARAIENQCYVAAVNRVGIDGMNISYSGDSQIVSPRGHVLSAAEQGREQLVYGTLSQSELNDFKVKFPTYLDADSFDIKL